MPKSLEDFTPQVQEMVHNVLILKADQTPAGRAKVRQILEEVERKVPQMLSPLREFFAASAARH